MSDSQLLLTFPYALEELRLIILFLQSYHGILYFRKEPLSVIPIEIVSKLPFKYWANLSEMINFYSP